MAHRNTSFLLSVIDFDPHVRLRALKHVRERFLLLSIRSILPIHCKGLVLSWTGQETHIELCVSVNHLHLLAELCDIESLGGLDGWRGFHWEDGSFLRLHLPQTHHVIRQIESVILRCSCYAHLIALSMHVKIARHSRLFLLKSDRVLQQPIYLHLLIHLA